MPNCDWGNPCDCNDCNIHNPYQRETSDEYTARQPLEKNCNGCKKEGNLKKTPTTTFFYKGFYNFNFYSYCEECYDAYLRKEEEEVAMYRKYRQDIVDIEHKTIVPIKYGYDEFRKKYPQRPDSDIAIRKNLIALDLFMVQKIKNRWYCSKEKIDGIDDFFMLKVGK